METCRGLVCFIISGLLLHVASAEVLPLEGTWRFELDAADKGERERWFARELTETISLPGTTDEAKKGEGVVSGRAVESIHPQMLDADRSSRFASQLSRRHPYICVAWYQRNLVVPAIWQGRRVVLKLERTKLTSVWIDEVCLGQ